MYGIDTYAMVSNEVFLVLNMCFRLNLLTGRLQQASSTFGRPSCSARGRACRKACRHLQRLIAHSSHKYHLDYEGTQSRIFSRGSEQVAYLSDPSKVEFDMTEHSALCPILPHIQVALFHDFSISTFLRTSSYWHSTRETLIVMS